MNICVYGASSNEIANEYMDRVFELGKLMAERGHGLVFGGGAQGLMGAAARGVKSADGKIYGVAPSFFNVDGVLYQKCTELIYTETMRERKQIMENMADAFIMAPGGIGTFEEFFEILTLKQLGRHNKPIAIFNVRGYYTDICRLIDKAIDEGFMKPACRELFCVSDSVGEIVEYIEKYDAGAMDVRHLKNI